MNAPLKLPAAISGQDLQLANIARTFGELTVLNGVNLTIQAGEFIALVGRSGCGKSTLLRLLAGLDKANQGEILLGGEPLAKVKQDVRLMFQDDRLLPWKNIIDNVGLGLKGQWQARALQVLDEVGLADKANAWPAQLSGGQRQRVALARALIHQPRLLLLDEPLGALDALTRLEMQQLIERLWLTHGFTVVLVTHDVPEAIQLADRVIILEQGTVGFSQTIALPRPRDPASAEAAALSGAVLSRVLQQSVTPLSSPREHLATLRWAW